MGLLSAANGTGRLLYGSGSDWLGRAPAMFLGAFLMCLAIWLTIPATRAFGAPGLALAVLLIGSSYGAGVPLATALTSQLFGTRRFGTNMGITSSQIALGGLLGPQMAGFLRTSTGSYESAFVITGALALAACALAVAFGLRLRRARGAVSTSPLP
jgi:OFA family oxalate/formate antiporter-like MFS transporter